jgi:hypothetical protein
MRNIKILLLAAASILSLSAMAQSRRDHRDNRSVRYTSYPVQRHYYNNYYPDYNYHPSPVYRWPEPVYPGPYYGYAPRVFPSVSVVIGAPPVHVTVLPYGYRRLYRGPELFFYFDGLFYRKQKEYYEVINAPVGAELSAIPDGASVVVIDDKKYYRLRDTYFEERVHDGAVWYVVAAKNGRQASNEGPAAGSVVDRLPGGTNRVVLNDRIYEMSKDGVYYEEFVENGEIKYRVAGNTK